MSEIQIVYGSWPDDQRLKEAKRLRDLTDDPVETSYWDGFVLGIHRRIAGEDVWGGGMDFPTLLDPRRVSYPRGMEDGWRGPSNKKSLLFPGSPGSGPGPDWFCGIPAIIPLSSDIFVPKVARGARSSAFSCFSLA